MKLHEPHAPLHEPPREQAAAAEVGGPRVVEAVELFRLFGLARQIDHRGFQVAGPEAWPMPVRLNPGMDLRPPLVWELEPLTGCLRDVPAFIAGVPKPKRGLLGGGGSTEPSTWTPPAGWRLSWE